MSRPRYWWVSQNQTYSHEVGGGFMWAPKTNRTGIVPQSYRNMTEISPGDIIFSFAGGLIKSIGVALSAAYTSPKPRNFARAGDAWNDEGWKVDVIYVPTRVPISPRDHMGVLRDQLPIRNSPIRVDGVGNQVYLCEISEEFGSTLIVLTGSEVPSVPVTSLADLVVDEDEQELITSVSLRETEKATLVLARRGQGLFRSRVQSIEKRCRITGVEAEKFLIASHIKPWKSSLNDERIDGNNGLFLSPHVDKLFDGGFISFTYRGEILVSPKLDSDVLDKWSIDPQKNVGRFNADQRYFLEHHNDEKFIAA